MNPIDNREVSPFVDSAAQSESAVEEPKTSRRFGIMPPQEIPEDFDEMGREEIEKMFYGEE